MTQWTIAAALLLVLSTPPVFAQADGEGKSRSEMDFERAAGLSDSEKLDRSTEYLADMKSVLGTVLGILKTARDEKDIIKINCVNEKLTNIKGLLRISEQADITLQEAVAKGERESAVHEFHKISISHQKIKVLKTETEQCVGQLAFAVGKTTVDVEIDPNLVPADDPTQVDLPDTEVVRPPAASPYQ